MWTDLAVARHRLLRATLVLALLVPAAVAAESGAPEEELPTWRPPHDRGLELYEAGDYAAAAAAFEEALRLGAPAANLYNLARSYEQLERFSDALRIYDEYLAFEAIPPERRARAEARRDALATIPAEVHLESEPAGATVTVDGEPGDPPRITPTTVALPPGEHLLSLELEGHAPAERRVDVGPGEETSLAVTLSPLDLEPPRPPPEEPAPLAPSPEAGEGGVWRGAPWLLLGVGLAVAAVGVSLDVAAWVGAEERSEQFGSVGDYEAWYDGTGSMALAGDVLLGVGLATGAAGLIWGLVELARRGHQETEPEP